MLKPNRFTLDEVTPTNLIDVQTCTFEFSIINHDVLCKLICARCGPDKKSQDAATCWLLAAAQFFCEAKVCDETALLEQAAGTDDLCYPVQWGMRDNNEYIFLPVVPHKAVAEVSKIGNL